jgi:hypothetical protein
MFAFKHCFEQDPKGVAPEEYTSMPQWQNMMKMMKSKGIQI